MPANSLATVYALVADCADRNVLGRDVTINLTAIDETNKPVNRDKLIAEMRRNGNFGMVGLVGSSPTSSHARSTLRDRCGPPGFPL